MTRIYPSAAFPDTQPRDEKDHECGRCRTPWGISNPLCPGRRAEEGRRNG
jgi:hypothetical protein